MKLSRDSPANLFVPTKEEFYSYPRCKLSCEIENDTQCFNYFLEKVTYYFSVESPAKPTPIHQEIKTWKDEIYVVTGPAKMVPPLSDYLAFEAGCITPFDIVFRRVIEMGDFPKELKTSDLESVLHSGLI